MPPAPRPAAARLALAALIVLALASASRGDVLVDETFPFTALANTPVNGPVVFTATLAPWPDANYPVIPTPQGFPDLPDDVFTGVRFSAATVGQPVRITGPADDPDFADFVTALTDGRENYIVHTLRFYDGGDTPPRIFMEQRGGEPEREVLFDRSAGDPVDLSGHEITAITLRLDAFHQEQLPAPGPPRAKATGSLTLTIEGTFVPEPAAPAATLVAGVAMLRRRRHRRPAPVACRGR